MAEKVLVFGGAGYIGSHTCKALAQAGFKAVVFDNLSEGYRDFVRWGPLIEADILDASAVMKAIGDVKPAAIVHFAALAYVGESVTDPAKYYRNNVAGSLNIADAARLAGNVPIVFSSTCATYGVPRAVPIREDTPQNPINPYGRTKLAVEWLLDDFANAYGLRSVCLRYFNACGADPDGNVGEAHRDETHLIPRAIFSAMGRISDFSIFGGDYPTPDGSPIRDYIHVADLAEAHVLALKYLLSGGVSEKVNIGTGKGVSVFQLIDRLEAVTGLPVPRTLGPRRAGDPPALVADAGKARALLGFAARHSDLDSILTSAWAWHMRRHNS